MGLKNYLMNRKKNGSNRILLFINDLLNYLIKHCGLLSYVKGTTDGVMIDKVGRSARPAVQGVEILGDGNTYLDVVVIPEDDANWYWETEGNFNTLGTSVHGARNAGKRFYWGTIGGDWSLGYKGDSSTGANPSDTDNHVFKVTGDGKLYVDGDLKVDKSAVSGTIADIALFLMAQNVEGSPAAECDFNCKSSKFHFPDGTELILDTQGDTDGVYTFQPSDKSVEPILAQQVSPPVTPTQISLSVISLQDSYGYTIADGATLYKDSANTILYPAGTEVANYPDGVTSLGYIGVGIHASAQYKGRCKYDSIITDIAGTPIVGGLFEDGNYFKRADKYHEEIIDDTTEILYIAATGEPKVISITDVSNITLGEGGNPQMIINKDDETVAFYEEGLPVGSECLYKALTFQHLNEGYQVQTTESSGEFENYRVEEGTYFVIKEGVTVE